MRLLLISCNKEDIEKLIPELEKYYIIDIASDEPSSIYLSECNLYDIIVINSELPDMCGLELCSMIRSLQVETPIVLISDNNDCAYRVRSFDAGVDVIIFKPIDVYEILAQINVLTRRNGNSKNCQNTISSGNLSLNMKDKKFFAGETYIYLRRKEFDLMEYLMINRGRMVSKEELLEHVWEKGIDVISNTVEVHIRNIRMKLVNTEGEGAIKTRRGFGYEIET
ncbi:response regulator transcription factor [Patescibacteria group bacterium]|nr:response regulator transcription factor [Patescibacteria group bacterium]